MTDSSSSATIKVPDFLLGAFVCDLGHIIRGTAKSKRVKLRNHGIVPLSFDVTAKAFGGRCAFAVAPMKVSRLPPGESGAADGTNSHMHYSNIISLCSRHTRKHCNYEYHSVLNYCFQEAR